MVTTGNIIGNTIGVILKKPFVIIFWGVMMLITTLMGYMLPIFRILFEFGTIGSSNLFETLMSLIQLIYSYLSDVRIVAICVIAFYYTFFHCSNRCCLMSGYLYKLHNVVNRKESHKGEFSYGVDSF